MSANQVSHLDRIKKFQLRADSLFDQNELASQGFEKCAAIDQQIVEKPAMLLGINPGGGAPGQSGTPISNSLDQASTRNHSIDLCEDESRYYTRSTSRI